MNLAGMAAVLANPSTGANPPYLFVSASIHSIGLPDDQSENGEDCMGRVPCRAKFYQK
jgi:hypothetical protein